MARLFPRAARAYLLGLPLRLDGNGYRYTDEHTPKARLAPLLQLGVFHPEDFVPLDDRYTFKMSAAELKTLVEYLILNLEGDYGWTHGRAAYGYRKCVGKITVQLGSDEDRGFKEAILALNRRWSNRPPDLDSPLCAIFDLLRRFLRELKDLKKDLFTEENFTESYTHINIYDAGGFTDDHQDLNLVTRPARRALLVTSRSRRIVDFSLGNVRANGSFETNRARIFGSCTGSLLVSSRFAGGTEGLRVGCVDLEVSDPDSPAHACARPVVLCHRARANGACASIMMSGM